MAKDSATFPFSHLPLAWLRLPWQGRGCSAPPDTTAFGRLFPPLRTLVPKAVLIPPVLLHPKQAPRLPEEPAGMPHAGFAADGPLSYVLLLVLKEGLSCRGPGKPKLCSPAVLRSQEGRPSLYHVTAVISEDTVGFLTELSGRGRSQHLVWLGLPRMLAHFQLCM